MQLVTYKGGRLSAEAAHSMLEVDRLTPTIPVRVMQGGFNGTRVAASAGTHAGDAIDISVQGLTLAQITALVLVLRMVGWAAWYRPPNWDNRGGAPHIHAVPNGWGYPSAGARAQAVAYRAGLNGLARGGRDTGPRQYTRRTWGGYLTACGFTLDATGRVVLTPKNLTSGPVAGLAPTAKSPVGSDTVTDYETFAKWMDRYAVDVMHERRGLPVLHAWAAIPWHAGFGKLPGKPGTSSADWSHPLDVIRAMVRKGAKA